jgi:hypothetical protein
MCSTVLGGKCRVVLAPPVPPRGGRACSTDKPQCRFSLYVRLGPISLDDYHYLVREINRCVGGACVSRLSACMQSSFAVERRLFNARDDEASATLAGIVYRYLLAICVTMLVDVGEGMPISDRVLLHD